MLLKEKISRYLKKKRQFKNSSLHLIELLKSIERIDSIRRFDEIRSLYSLSNPFLSYGKKVFSQNDEDGIISEICNRIEMEKSRVFLEIGVGDGRENNTLNLLLKQWRGIWLGGEELAFECNKNNLNFEKCWITRENILPIVDRKFRESGVEKIDLLSIDIDGNDWHILKRLLESGVSPKICVVEYNGTFDVESEWIMPYDPAHVWDGSVYFSASLASYNSLLSQYGYFLVACNITGANAFFVHGSYRDRFPDVPKEWRHIYMAPYYLPYPYFGHAVTDKLLETFL